MFEKKRCEKCGSSQTRIRIIKKERVCNSCGHVEKIKEEIKT